MKNFVFWLKFQWGLFWRVIDSNTPKKFWCGCVAPIFDRIPLAKEILVENIPFAKENFLIMSPFMHDFKVFQPKYSLFKMNLPKTDANSALECQFLGVFIKNIPLAKDFGWKIYPWLRNFFQKIHLRLRNLGSKSDPWVTPLVKST